MVRSDLFYLKESYCIANKFSTDPSTQNGAIIVNKNGDIVAWGANHFPEGVKESEDRWKRPLKYKFVEHAERNCIYHAAARGVATKDCTMYCPWAACADCARAIIQSGIKEVITHHDPTLETRFKQKSSTMWLEEIKIAMQMFEEAEVKIKFINDFINEYDIKFQGLVVRP